MSSTMTDTVSGVEIPPIHISLDGNKAVPSIIRVLPAVEKIITVIVSRDGITKVTETLRKYGDRFDYLVSSIHSFLYGIFANFLVSFSGLGTCRQR